MKTLLPFIGFSALAAGAVHADPPAPKLVPRPLPGLGVVQPVPSEEDAATAENKLLAVPKAVVPVDPEMANRARVLVIRRRATLPPAMTADLAKPEAPSATPRSNSAQYVQARPGKIRIIPKSEVASMLAAPAQPKPAPEP